MYEDIVKSLKICGTPALINEKCIAFHDGCCEAEPVCIYELMRKAADAIEELQGRAKVLEKVVDKWCEAVPKWIPVTERLPEEGKFVLVYGDLYPNKHDGGVIAVSKRMDWNYWQGFGRERNITHWMPLPSAPAEE